MKRQPKVHKPFRIKKGRWYAFCEPCRKIVHRYAKGGWGGLMEPPMKCDRCGDQAKHEYYPMLKERMK